eukprot:13077420-Alexandrium_andersonii.AAC.1
MPNARRPATLSVVWRRPSAPLVVDAPVAQVQHTSGATRRAVGCNGSHAGVRGHHPWTGGRAADGRSAAP